MSQNTVPDKISRRCPQVLPNYSAECLRRQVQLLGVVGGRMQEVKVLLDQFLQLNEDGMLRGIRTRHADTRLGRLATCSENQQHLETGKHDLPKGEVTFALLLPNT